MGGAGSGARTGRVQPPRRGGRLDADLRAAIDALLNRKRAGAEQDAGPRRPTIHAFVEAELGRQDDLQFSKPENRPGLEPLNAFFRSVLNRSPSLP